MSRSFVLSMKKPHEAFGLRVPISRRVAEDVQGRWLTILFSVCAFAGLVFSIISVNQSAAKTFAIRSLEHDRERLVEQVSDLESRIASTQSLQAMQDRVKGRGYVPIEQVVYLNK